MKNPWKILGGIVGIAMAGYFAYGLIRFPDSPIHPCGQGRYCGKQGQPRTLEDYRAHQLWQTGLMWGWPVGMVLIILIKRKIPPTNWQLMSPDARYRVLHGSKVDYAEIRKTYDDDHSDSAGKKT
jgi:hypothetical protein